MGYWESGRPPLIKMAGGHIGEARRTAKKSARGCYKGVSLESGTKSNKAPATAPARARKRQQRSRSERQQRPGGSITTRSGLQRCYLCPACHYEKAPF